MDISGIFKELKSKGYLVTREALNEAVKKEAGGRTDKGAVGAALNKIRKSPSRFFNPLSSPARWSSSLPPEVQKCFKGLIIEGRNGREFLRNYAGKADYKAISSSEVNKALSAMPPEIHQNYQACLDKAYYFVLALRTLGDDVEGLPIVLSDLPEDIMFDYAVFLKSTLGDERARKWIGGEQSTDQALLDIRGKHAEKMIGYEMKRMAGSAITFGGSDHFVAGMENAREGNKKEAAYHFAASIVLNVLAAASYVSPLPEESIIANGIIKALRHFGKRIPALNEAADFLLQEVKVVKTSSGKGYNISLGNGKDTVNLNAFMEGNKWQVKKWEVSPPPLPSLPVHARNLSAKLGTNLDDVSSYLTQLKNSGIKMEDVLGIVKNKKTGQVVFLDKKSFLEFKQGEIFKDFHGKSPVPPVQHLEAEQLLKAAQGGEQFGSYAKGMREYGFIYNMPKTKTTVFVIIDDLGKITGYRIH